MTSEQINIWRSLIELINSKNIGYIFKRSQLLSVEDCQHRSKRFNTTDTYKAYLQKIGFLETVSPGRYQLVKKIPPELSLGKARKLVSDNSWRTWFMSIEDRIKNC